jgi:CheY-like chemotaxis protein
MSAKNHSPRLFRVLLVEDNDDDVLLTKHAFKKAALPVEFQVAKDGVDALEILHAPAKDGAALPDIILLDLNMPRMDGRQLLAILKRDQTFKIIPTIILTTSAAEDDVCTAYGNYANSYMVKPMELSEFAKRIKGFVDFWFDNIATLPKQAERALAQST